MACEESPRVSIVVPTRDRPELLGPALRSVLEQTFMDWECLVVDDAGTAPVTVPADCRFRIVRREQPGGPGAARNTGLRHAAGRFAAFLDDDDLWPLDWLEVLVPHARSGVIVVGSIEFIDGLRHPAASDSWDASTNGAIVDNPPHLGQALCPVSSTVWFDEEFTTGEDYDWWLRMGLSHKVRTVDRVHYRYRRHSGARHLARDIDRLRNRERLIDKHEQWFTAHPRSYAKQLARCSAAALVVKDYSLARTYALRSIREVPTRTGFRLLGHAVARGRWIT